jgi:hypothetical protein
VESDRIQDMDEEPAAESALPLVEGRAKRDFLKMACFGLFRAKPTQNFLCLEKGRAEELKGAADPSSFGDISLPTEPARIDLGSLG